MFLKNLTLKGFKSFAEQASLDLEPGVTVVVGPNGSGKSNVVDAVAWVLGAQAPSAVRSQKMDDVIFAGTSARKALGRAEVALTIDNTSGVLPVEFTEVTITRTLFRSGDSEYAINGVPCRLLDITELLSDGGVGRQQHVIVSQGQIDAVLNARPEDRRSIIEEAAGVLKYRKRKDRAERRLSSTDSDVVRVKDLQREVRRQLKPLERQAEAARRHGDLIAELTALRVHLAGREVAQLRQSLAQLGEQRATRSQRTVTSQAELETLNREINENERRLAEHGGDDLGDVLVRLESLRERARGLSALLVERSRGIERDRQAFTDRAVIANLEAEAARCRSDLMAVDEESRALLPETERLNEAEQRLAADRATFEDAWGDGVPVPSGRASEIRGELGALRAAMERATAEIARLDSRLAELANQAELAQTEANHRRAELTDLHETEAPLIDQVDAAELAEAAGNQKVADAEALVGETQSIHQRWVARAEALTMALDDARASTGVKHLGELDGVLGTLLELVAVDPGYEAAFEAAAGEALKAVIVRDVDTARRALDALVTGDTTGAVLALGHGSSRPVMRPAGAEPVRAHIRGIVDGVDGLLDVLLGSAVAVDGDWTVAAEVALGSPELVVVTMAGDRFSSEGWRIGESASGATGAALDEATTEAETSRQVWEQARETLATARSEQATARDHRRALARQLDDLDGRSAAASAALNRAESDRRDVSTEHEALQARYEELTNRLAREQERVDELDALLPELDADENERLAEGRRLAEARQSIDERAVAVGALRTDLEVRAAGLDERRQFLKTRLAEIDERLDRDASERAAVAAQRVDLDRRGAVLEALATAVVPRAAVVDESLHEVRERRRRQSEAAQAVTRTLDQLRKSRTEADRLVETLRTETSKAEVLEAQMRSNLEHVIERIRTEHRITPDVAVSAPMPESTGDIEPATRVSQLESELDIIGAVNPLALEEYETLQERSSFLQGQMDDIRAARRELKKVISSIDEEIVSVFASAFADVSVNFEQLFQTLFPGGQGGIRLTEPDDLLNTGIEIEARPSGKNVRKLSLLSGGERTLVALAFLFAVFRSRPSPFYVMDEVEAALDDVNLHRFLSLVDEFRADAQLLLVSHQKRTMEAADCLYGVTMAPGGSSKVVSEKVAAA